MGQRRGMLLFHLFLVSAILATLEGVQYYGRHPTGNRGRESFQASETSQKNGNRFDNGNMPQRNSQQRSSQVRPSPRAAASNQQQRPQEDSIKQTNPTLYKVVESPRTGSTVQLQLAVQLQERPQLSWEEMDSDVLLSYQFGFPSDTTVESLFKEKATETKYQDVTKKVNTFEMLYRMGSLKCNKGPDSQKVQCMWDFMTDIVLRLRSHTHASMSTGLSNDDMRAAFIFKVCVEKEGRYPLCPRPCGQYPCSGRSHVAPQSCRQTNNGLYQEDFRCSCADQHKWNPTLQQCVNSAGSYDGKEVVRRRVARSAPEDECASVNCNNGYCLVEEQMSDPVCICNEGFEGEFCETLEGEAKSRTRRGSRRRKNRRRNRHRGSEETTEEETTENKEEEQDELSPSTEDSADSPAVETEPEEEGWGSRRSRRKNRRRNRKRNRESELEKLSEDESKDLVKESSIVPESPFESPEIAPSLESSSSKTNIPSPMIKPAVPELGRPTNPELRRPSEPVVNIPTEPEIRRPSAPEIRRPSEPVVNTPTEPEIRRPSFPEIRRPSVPEIRRPDSPAISSPALSSPSEPTNPMLSSLVRPAVAAAAVAAAKLPIFPGIEEPSSQILDAESSSVNSLAKPASAKYSSAFDNSVVEQRFPSHWSEEASEDMLSDEELDEDFFNEFEDLDALEAEMQTGGNGTDSGPSKEKKSGNKAGKVILILLGISVPIAVIIYCVKRNSNSEEEEPSQKASSPKMNYSRLNTGSNHSAAQKESNHSARHDGSHHSARHDGSHHSARVNGSSHSTRQNRSNYSNFNRGSNYNTMQKGSNYSTIQKGSNYNAMQ